MKGFSPRPTRREMLAMLLSSLAATTFARSSAEVDKDRSPIFTDATASAGIDWEHFSGESQDRFLLETMGGGVAFFDFNNDGLLDLYFVNGGETPRGKSPKPVRNALYRNLGNGRFEEVAQAAGVDKIPFYGMGVAAADYDNDGFQDLFVTGYPRSTLFHNNGDGTFRDVTEKAGVLNAGKWGTSAAWFDYDRDGLLDLFVCNYVHFSYSDTKRCEMAGHPGYCVQTAYEGDSPTLYHNNGDGTFTDVTAQAGLDKLAGRALGVVAVDINDDGWDDLFVARDASPNLLLINRKDGTFTDMGLDAGVAVSESGSARAGMGVDAGDINDDGIPDFCVTNFTDEYHALFVSDSPLQYEDRGAPSGIAGATRLDVGFGAHFLDYDNDGNLDLMILNGHVNELMERARPEIRYRELPLLMRNAGSGVFQDMGATAGPFFQTPRVARGLAIGDFNNDGSLDAAVTSLNAKPVLLRNGLKGNRWIGLQLEGVRSNRDAIGAKVTVRLGKWKLIRWVTGGSSYLASHDRRVVIGLGNSAETKVSVEIRWPRGLVQTVADLPLNTYHKIREAAVTG
jgi:hypothetical protein